MNSPSRKLLSPLLSPKKKVLQTVLFLIKDDKVLLGMKKRGFGAGKWNGFGGKVEHGESIEAAANRELFEECGIRAKNLQQKGIISVDFKNRPLEVHTFVSNDYEGEIRESEEMKPQWFNINEIPYHEMWEGML